jgi:hypothetical protein
MIQHTSYYVMIAACPGLCKSGVCQCARQPVKWSPKWRGGSILFQPCWTSNKTCPWFIHNRIHCMGDPSWLALKATFFVACQRKCLLSQCLFFVSHNGWGTTAQLSHGWSKSAGNLAKWTPRARRCWRAALSWNPTAKRASKSVLRRA